MRILTISLIVAGLAACGTSTPADSASPESRVDATPDEQPLSFEELHVTSDALPQPDVEPDVGFEVATLEAPVGTGLPDTEAVEVVETTEPTVPLTTYSLRRGETLAHFARWAELPVEDIAESSELPLDGQYAVGTELAIPLSPELRSQVETRRDAHHRTRAEHYLASRGANETEFYSVKTGDSAWTIANDRHGMPVWLLESLNPSSNLERLRPGDELLVPVFTDIVAEAPSDELIVE